MKSYIMWAPVIIIDQWIEFYNAEKDEMNESIPDNVLPYAYKDRSLAEADIVALKILGYLPDIAKLKVTEDNGSFHWKLIPYTQEELSMYYGD